MDRAELCFRMPLGASDPEQLLAQIEAALASICRLLIILCQGVAVQTEVEADPSDPLRALAERAAAGDREALREYCRVRGEMLR